MVMSNEQKRAMYAKNKGVPKHLGNLDAGTYTNNHGDSYKVMPDKTMYLYDYLLMKNHYINDSDFGREVGRNDKPRWQPMTKKRMIEMCDANKNDHVCKTSIANAVTTYTDDNIKNIKMYCQAHAMNLNFMKVKQDGSVIPRT